MGTKLLIIVLRYYILIWLTNACLTFCVSTSTSIDNVMIFAPLSFVDIVDLDTNPDKQNSWNNITDSYVVLEIGE